MEEKEKEPRPLGVCGQIEKIAESICDNYCKYPALYADTPDGEQAMIEAECQLCPLMQLLS